MTLSVQLYILLFGCLPVLAGVVIMCWYLVKKDKRDITEDFYD